MKRLFAGVAVTLLIVAGVGAAILVLSSRDSGALDSQPAATAPATTTPSEACVPDGNVTVVYTDDTDRIRVDRLAERLGALNTDATRAAGQAIIIRRNKRLGRVVAKTACGARLEIADARDPQLETFVREHLGTKGAATP